MLFLADADHWGHKKAKWTRRYLLGHRRILKKGDFITPPVNPFFQKENGGLKCNISKPPSSCKAGRLLLRCYSTFSIDSTMFIFAIERSGIAVASRQAATETTAASIIAMTGTVTSCKVSVFAAPTKIQQT